MPSSVQARDDPPELKKGSVIPTTGRSEMHIPILIMHCEASIAKYPTQM